MKNLKISEDTHKLFKEYCKNNHLKMNEYVDFLLHNFLFDTERNKENVKKINNR